MQADHRPDQTVRTVAPVATIVTHAGIPAHAAEGGPTWRQADINRLRVGIVLREWIPVRPRLCGIVQKAARRDIECRNLAVVDKVHAATGRLSELHHVQVLINKGNDNGSLFGIELIAALIEYGALNRNLLADWHICPIIDLALPGSLRNRHRRGRRGHHHWLVIVGAARQQRQGGDG